MALDELKNIVKDAPISSIIGYFRPLTRKGNTTVCLCPFHDDTKPSMHVNDQKGLFKCFACDAGGDAITFVQKINNLEFVDALRDIAKILGLNFDDYVEKKKSDPQRDMAIKILTKAIQIYRKLGTDKNCHQFSKFIEERKVTEEISQQFQLGYAPNTNIMSEYLKSIPDEKERNFALSTAVKIGLIRESKRHGQTHYDTFRERIMFPIWDQFGKPQGFTSRTTKEDQQPKYLNSAESFIFKKKNLLYGLSFAKSSVRERDCLILCEGNMDVIALHQYGFTNAVAIMGTAFTQQSLSIFKGLTKNVLLALDSDKMGYEASIRANRMFMESEILPRYINFDELKDPDDFLKKKGQLALAEKLENPKTFLDVHVESYFPSETPELVEQKYEILKKIFHEISPLSKSIAATERILEAAKRLGLKSDSSIILNEYFSYLEKEQQQPKVKTANETPSVIAKEKSLEDAERLSQSADERKTPANTLPLTLSKALKNFLKVVVLHPECLAHESLQTALDLVGSVEVKKYVAKLKEVYFEVDDSEYPSMVQETLKGEDVPMAIKETVGGILYHFKHHPLEEDIVEKMITDVCINLQKAELKLKREELKLMQKDSKSIEDVNKILREINEIQKELENIKSQPIRSDKGV